MATSNIPLATYRLQFNSSFTFKDAAELLPYLDALGISHCYASPYLRARPGSTHGYDIIDHSSLNPEIGTTEDFDRFVQALHEHKMGQILDIVPNHMGIMGSDNAWWLDVLENGEASPYAAFFDIDWHPVKDELQAKVLVPVLGDQYGSVLDRGELKLNFDREKGEFGICYFKHRFPVNPKEYSRILGYNISRLEQELGPQNQSLLELQSLMAAFDHLPGRTMESPEKRTERIRDKEINKRRLAALCAQSPEVLNFVQQNVREINGTPGHTESFEQLHALIKAQAYRLAYWRVAADDINYRRFFDVNDLAGIRMENPAVFEATHRFILGLIEHGKLGGLRVDHPDGLYDPAEYFRRLQCAGAASASNGNGDCASRHLYVVIEKILTGDERLPESWPVEGTTGYGFTNLSNGLFVDPDAHGDMDRIYRGFIGDRIEFNHVAYVCKKLVMRRALASELNVLSNMLIRIALSDRHTCDFTLNNLRDALSEVIARFPVYRTYITAGQVSQTDRRYIEQAVRAVKRHSNVADASVFDFIQRVLLTDIVEGHTRTYREAVIHFAMKFQQFTSVVMAKGMEDTAFYRYGRLLSLNEVGGNPGKFGTSVDEFHRTNATRAGVWPHSMLATSTHDTKRSEDVRARINVLSEIPGEWRHQVRRWRALNKEKHRLADEKEAPSRADEYFLYQTLMGAWPLHGEQPTPEFCERIRAYMLKAIREAKEQTSWANQNTDYESAVTGFVDSILQPGNENRFLAEFLPFQKRVAHFGMLNSLSQLVLKLASPGVPDFYQGTELWDFSLVDPDNRRPVDYALRQQQIKGLTQMFGSGPSEAGDRSPQKYPAAAKDAGEVREKVRRMAAHFEDGCIKLYLTWKGLTFRRQHQLLFLQGEYLPLTVTGPRAKHVVAYARKSGESYVICVAGRFFAQLSADLSMLPYSSGGLPGPLWQETFIELPEQLRGHRLRNIFTAAATDAWQEGASKNLLPVNDVLADLPAALLSNS